MTTTPPKKEFNLFAEAQQLCGIAAPTILIQLALFLTFPMAASSVGRERGTTELAAFSLGTLLGNLTCLSILEGTLTAADTLMPRAYGLGRFEEVGRLAVRAALVCCLLLIPPMLPLCLCADSILVTLGQDEEASLFAQEWIRFYFLGVPPNLVFRVLMRFLLAQDKPWPMVFSSAIPCIFLHPVLLRYLVPSMGLSGSALAIVITQWATATLLVSYVWCRQPHEPDTWPGISASFLRSSLRWQPLMEFISLSVGGIFSMMEWWFFELMCFIAGSFGIVSLCAHTIAYNIVPLVFMLPLGILVGLTVRMGYLIAEYPSHAKQLAAWCMAFTTLVVGTIVVSCLYIFRMSIILSFTNDEHVVTAALHIWGHLCVYLWLLHIFGISQAILRALGMQWRLASITCVCLYMITLPTVVYFAMLQGGGLFALWTVLPICYIFMQVALAVSYLIVDWEQHGARILEEHMHNMSQSFRGIKEKSFPTEETLLLPTEQTP